MISNIKNKILRIGLLIFLSPIFFLLYIFIYSLNGIKEGIFDWFRDTKISWSKTER